MRTWWRPGVTSHPQVLLSLRAVFSACDPAAADEVAAMRRSSIAEAAYVVEQADQAQFQRVPSERAREAAASVTRKLSQALDVFKLRAGEASEKGRGEAEGLTERRRSLSQGNSPRTNGLMAL